MKTLYWTAFATLSALFVSLALATGFLVHAQTLPQRAQLGGQLDIGATGPDVETLQTFLASDRSVYPQGIVSGYYGPLTATAVAQFQVAYGLPPVGRVGPLTLARVNQLLANGAALDVDAPFVSNLAVATSSSSATITWDTSEQVFGSVHYGLSPIALFEVSAPHTEPQTSGTLVAEAVPGTAHSLTINGLSPNQTYYFSTESRDVAGNITVTLSRSFQTH